LKKIEFLPPWGVYLYSLRIKAKNLNVKREKAFATDYFLLTDDYCP